MLLATSESESERERKFVIVIVEKESGGLGFIYREVGDWRRKRYRFGKGLLVKKEFWDLSVIGTVATSNGVVYREEACAK